MCRCCKHHELLWRCGGVFLLLLPLGIGFLFSFPSFSFFPFLFFPISYRLFPLGRDAHCSNWGKEGTSPTQYILGMHQSITTAGQSPVRIPADPAERGEFQTPHGDAVTMMRRGCLQIPSFYRYL